MQFRKCASYHDQVRSQLSLAAGWSAPQESRTPQGRPLITLFNVARYLAWCRSLHGSVGMTAQPHAIDLTLSCVGVVVCFVVGVLLVVWSLICFVYC